MIVKKIEDRSKKVNVFYLIGAKEGLNVLPEEESKHCVKVLRMTEGEHFCVTDGEGSLSPNGQLST